MKNIVKYMLACLLVVGLAISVPAVSQARGGKGKGLQKSHQKKAKKEGKVKKNDVQSSHGQEASASSRPYGWSRGRKTGWRGGSYPPGWRKWDKDKQTEWKDERVESIEDIDTYLVRYEFPETQSARIVGAFDQAIAGGMAINEARKKIVDGLKDGDVRRNLMIDAAQESLNLLR